MIYRFELNELYLPDNRPFQRDKFDLRFNSHERLSSSSGVLLCRDSTQSAINNPCRLSKRLRSFLRNRCIRPVSFRTSSTQQIRIFFVEERAHSSLLFLRPPILFGLLDRYSVPLLRKHFLFRYTFPTGKIQNKRINK